MVQKSFFGLPALAPAVLGVGLATKGKGAPENEVEKFVYTSEDDNQLRQQLTEIANDFSCTDGAQREWAAYFNNPANIQGIREALAKYGLPPKNRKSYKKDKLFGKWVNFCDWGDTFRFYYYAKIAQDYPALNPNNKQNCYQIKGYVKALEQEKANVTKQYTVTSDNERYKRQVEVLTEKINDYNSLYSSMLCDRFIMQQDQLLSEQQRARALKQSQNINMQTYEKTSGAAGGGTKIALYAFGGAALLIGIMVLAKKR